MVDQGRNISRHSSGKPESTIGTNFDALVSHEPAVNKAGSWAETINSR
jgi:hypothetical protein